MLRTRSLLLLCVVMLCSTAWSDNPAPSAAKPTEPKQSHATQTNNGPTADKPPAQQSPIVINNAFSPNVTKGSSSKESNQRYEESPWKRVWEALTSISTVVLVIVTGALVLFTEKLWGSTSELVRGSEKRAERQLRAYLNIEKFNYFSHRDPRRENIAWWSIHPIWINGGAKHLARA